MDGPLTGISKFTETLTTRIKLSKKKDMNVDYILNFAIEFQGVSNFMRRFPFLLLFVSQKSTSE